MRLAAVVLLALAAGCSSTSDVVFQDVRSDLVRDRVMVVIDSTSLPPLSEPRHRAILERIEARVAALPHIRRTITRRETFALTEGNFRVRSDYQVYADTLSSAGVSDRELAQSIGKALGADLLFNAQAYYSPCSYCANGGSAYLVAQVIDAPTGKLLVRINLRAHPAPNEQALADAFGAMEEEMLDEFNLVLTPKAHQERFRNLARRHAS